MGPMVPIGPYSRYGLERSLLLFSAPALFVPYSPYGSNVPRDGPESSLLRFSALGPSGPRGPHGPCGRHGLE